MSQYEYKLEDGKLTVRFGWDPPLQTFYLQLKDETVDDEEEDPMILWLGTNPREIYEVEDLIKAAPFDYRDLVESCTNGLYDDKDMNRA